MDNNGIVDIIKVVGGILTPIVLAYIALKQNQMNKKQDLIKEQTDGKLAELMKASKSASLAQGKLEGMAANNPDIQDISKETDTPVIEPGTVIDVKIVDQEKPVDVNIDTSKKDKS